MPRATDPASGSARDGLPAARRAGEAITVVMVTYSPGDYLEVSLRSLVAATSHPYRVILVDNGSTDGAPEQAEAAYEYVDLIRTGANLGLGGAANIGVDAADTRWAAVVNPDVEWQPGSLDALLQAGNRWPRAGALGPAILTEDGALYPSGRALPSLGRGIGHALAGWWWPGNPWTRSYRGESGVPREGIVGWLSGSCLLLRREAFLAVHGFDPGFFMYFEDTDLGRRLAAAGWPSVYVPDAVIVHTGGHATRRAPTVMTKAHHRSAYRYLSMRYAGARYFPLRLVLRAGLVARAAVARVIGAVGRGAQPTRGADALAEPPPVHRPECPHGS